MKLFISIFLVVILCFTKLGILEIFAQNDTSEVFLSDSMSSYSNEERVVTYIILADEFRTSNPVKSFSFSALAIEYSAKTSDNHLKISALKTAGKVYKQLGNYEKAIEYFDKAMYIAKENNNQMAVAELHNSLGTTYSYLGRYFRSLDILFQASEIALTLGNDSLNAQIFNEIGIVYGNLENYGQSLKYFQKALLIYELTANPKEMASTLSNIGNVYQRQSEYDIALDYGIKALSIHKKIDDQVGIATSLRNLGILSSFKNDNKTAIEYYTQSLTISESLKDVNSIIICLIKIAGAEIALDQFDVAKSHLDSALVLAIQSKTQGEIRSVYYNLAQLYSSKKDYENALINYTLYSDYNDSILNVSTSEKIANLQINFEILEKDRENKFLLEGNNYANQRLKNEKVIRNYSIVGGILLLIVFLFIYNRYRIKKNADSQLDMKNRIIQQINRELKELNFQLEKRVEERTQELQVLVGEMGKTEIELIKEKDRAEKANSLKDSFLANMSHEIRTPMNGIRGFIDILRDESLKPEERREYLAIIDKSSKYLLNVINDIIDISKISAGQLRTSIATFNIKDVFDDLEVFFSAEVAKDRKMIDLHFILELDKRKSLIISDHIRINQILINLINNAIKFSDEGIIEVKCRLLDPEFLIFSVRDQGPGISQEGQQFIFDRFRQVDESNTRKRGGTGLGLTISKGLVDILGGKMWVESIPGGGSTFLFTIPYTIGKGKKMKKFGSSVTSDYDWGDVSMLIAEDDQISFFYLKNILGKTNINITRAENGKEAVDICLSRKFDIILMDIQLPIMNGYDATRAIKKIAPETVIIAQTANAMADDKEKCLAAGCNDYIPKPIQKELLLFMINENLKKT